MRIVFMGTPEFAVPALEGLLYYSHDIVAVYTQPDGVVGRGRVPSFPAVKTVALAHGLPVFQPRSLAEETDRIVSLQPEVIVLAAYAQFLPARILAIPPFGCLNIHPSLLPRHRGSSPVVAAILEGDEVTGVSIMIMDKGLDTGPVLAQEAVSILSDDTAGSLNNRLAQVGARLLLTTLTRWVSGILTPQSQDASQATLSKKLVKEDGEIDWHCTSVELWRKVRAFQPWPGCFTRWRGRLLKLIEVVPIADEIGTEVGSVRRIKGSAGTYIGVQTGAGALRLLKVQLEGKGVMAVEEFERGQKGFVGALLPS